MEWMQLGAVSPGALGPAREALHWAVQVVAAAGESFVPHQPDTSHTALVWLESHRALAGAEIAGRWPCRLAVRVADLTLLLLDRQGAPHAALPLEGQTLAEANLWAAEAIRTHTRGEHAHALVHPGFELPPSALGRGGRFATPRSVLAELGLWYANADAELGAFALRTPGAGPVRCWPHHLDIATLVNVEGARPRPARPRSEAKPSEGEGAGMARASEPSPVPRSEAKPSEVEGAGMARASKPSPVPRSEAKPSEAESGPTIGVGVSPGDQGIPEPYAYVNHFPAQQGRTLPVLDAGVWNTSGWLGALLSGSELVAAGDARKQQELFGRFVASAVAANRTLLS